MAAVRKRGLGRGLDALLGTVRSEVLTEPRATMDSPSPRHQVSTLPLDFIDRGRYQPRRDFDPDSLRELADSIATQGVLQPILVRRVAGGRYEIVAGERRWRAAQLAGLAEMPVLIREVDEQSAVAIGLIENIQRDDLHPLEEAAALHRLLTEFELTHQQVAHAVGKSRTAVTNLLRLLDLNPEVKDYLDSRQLEMGHARALLGLKGSQQSLAARQVVSRGLSVRETEKLVRGLQAREEEALPSKARALHPDVRRLQDDLAERLGALVEIRQGSKGKGKLVIAYNSLDELDGILAHIR